MGRSAHFLNYYRFIDQFLAPIGIWLILILVKKNYLKSKGKMVRYWAHFKASSSLEL